jgi:hypothetical protein
VSLVRSFPRRPPALPGPPKTAKAPDRSHDVIDAPAVEKKLLTAGFGSIDMRAERSSNRYVERPIAIAKVADTKEVITGQAKTRASCAGLGADRHVLRKCLKTPAPSLTLQRRMDLPRNLGDTAWDRF